MIREQSIDVWGKGREFPFLREEEKQQKFVDIKNGCSSAFVEERQWSIEAMYRLLWDFSDGQRSDAINTLTQTVSDKDAKCSEYAIKGLQYSIEFLNKSDAVRIIDALSVAVTKDSPEIVQVVSIEVVYSIFLRFSQEKEMALKSVNGLLYFESINPEWLKRTVSSIDRLHSLRTSLTSGVSLQQIGIIRNGYSTLKQMDDFDPESISEVHIWPEFQADLKGVETLEHVVVVCLLDEQNPSPENSSQKKSKHKPGLGQFATSHPLRRNPIFYKTGVVSRVEGSTLYVQGIRVLDMTPVIDIRAPNIHDVNGLALCRKS